MDQATLCLRKLLHHPQFEERVIAALRSVTAIEGNTGFTDEEWLAQTVRGFVSVALEAAEGHGIETRDMFFATIVPGILADGLTPSGILRSSTTFLSLLGSELVLEAAPLEQANVTRWFARFAGSYIDHLYEACTAPHAS